MIVVSRTHSLFPLARRLGDVELYVWNGSYDLCWTSGCRPLRDEDGHPLSDLVADIVKAAEAGTPIISDVHELATVCRNAPTQWINSPPRELAPLQLGGWWDGKQLHDPHLLVWDMGLWPGGLGPWEPGGLTIVHSTNVGPAALPWLWQAALSSVGDCRGLLRATVRVDRSGTPTLDEPEVGWLGLHTHAWLGEREHVREALLEGYSEAVPRFTVVAPLSCPPSESRPFGGLTPQQRSRVFWHDVLPGGDPMTGGLDGIVGVVRAQANSFDLARGEVVETFSRVQLYEKQFRIDVGGQVANVLAVLERDWQVRV